MTEPRAVLPMVVKTAKALLPSRSIHPVPTVHPVSQKPKLLDRLREVLRSRHKL